MDAGLEPELLKAPSFLFYSEECSISSHFRPSDVAKLKGAKWLRCPLRGTDPRHFRPADVWIGWQTCLARVGEISPSMTTVNARRGKILE
ncbi:hypothetical protein BLNAU_18649 [Blattamonas nauphoetae]|uniref:Uncharacterized protein n=1 Tax=Blattamonas nauphoetae TaxID=2049346 RepID=A0ABQ9X493_9EUKA|nr:hypothetical protein BLNAU_18649 [Blattamonas nauphoetae]